MPTAAANEAVAQGRLASAVSAPLMTTHLLFTGVPPNAVDIHLRKALAHAIDRRLLGTQLMSNQTPAQGGLVPPGLIGHTPDSVLAFDPELARQFVQQSSHRGPFRLAIPPNWRMPFLAALVEAWRTDLNLEIEIVEMAVQKLSQLPILAHAGLGIWLAGYPDPEYFLHALLHSRSSSNLSQWSSPTFDALVDRALAQDSSAARLALFHEADRMAVQQECSTIPLIYTRVTALLQPWVHGWWAWAVPSMTFDELTVDERSPRYRGLTPKDQGA